jgi:nitroreductase
MDAIECMHRRRSIRSYQANPVARELIEELLWAAVQAPTPPASGNDAWAICVIEGHARLERYGERARVYAFEHQPSGRPWEWTVRPGFKVFWGAPVLVLLCARTGNLEAAFDCCRAGQNLLLAAQARSLGACWVGAPIPWLADARTHDELALPQGFEPAVAIILGYPAETPTGSPRPRPRVQWL